MPAHLGDDVLAGGRAVFFSPHLDDAVLSAGGLVAERTARSLASTVVTVFAGVPNPPYSDFATAFHASCSLGPQPVRERIAEDRAAVAALGARAEHVGLLDAIYRSAGGAWLYDGTGRTFAPPPPGDRPVREQVEQAVLDVVRAERPNVILGPMAFGEHVDHVLVARAVRRAAAATGLPAFFWEDLPYALLTQHNEISSLRDTARVSQVPSGAPRRSRTAALLDNGPPWGCT